MMLKGTMQFRSITQVPMIWSDPSDRSERQVDGLAQTHDIGATILERARLAPYHGFQGESFLDAVYGGDTVKDEILIEFNDGAAKFGFPTPARVRTLRTKKWRFTVYAGQDWGELYDIEADPNETRNLWDSADHLGIRGDMALRLAHQMARHEEESPKPTQMA